MNTKLKKDWYSIVLYPQKEIIGRVKIMKDELALNVGHYKSRNSEAHMTIVNLMLIQMNFFFINIM